MTCMVVAKDALAESTAAKKPRPSFSGTSPNEKQQASPARHFSTDHFDAKGCNREATHELAPPCRAPITLARSVHALLKNARAQCMRCGVLSDLLCVWCGLVGERRGSVQNATALSRKISPVASNVANAASALDQKSCQALIQSRRLVRTHAN